MELPDCCLKGVRSLLKKEDRKEKYTGYCWRNYFRKENPGINYLLLVESNESRKNMVPENLKTIYANSKNP